MRKCPFNKDNVCENCSLFIPNPTPSSAKPNGVCAINKIAVELERIENKSQK